MLVPLDWLREIINIELSAKDIAEILTMLGLEVEGIEEGEVPILDVKVTSNRGDCLSIIGIARELSAKLALPLNLPTFTVEEGDKRAEELAEVEIWDPELCPRYCARIVLGVEVKESPQWLQERLTRAGIRAINNIVDATNYTMLLTGQPIHAFDYDLIRGRKIIVRRAEEGERLTTLDGVERILSSDMLVIADAERAIAIAGVMGGQNTEVTLGTENVLIEAAHFNAGSIRKTARALQMSTDASYRFERYVDPYLPPLSATYCASLMKSLAGGEVAKGIIDVFPKKIFPRIIHFPYKLTNQLLGTNLTKEKIISYLRNLQLDVRDEGENLVVVCPTHRPDLKEPADLVEEIARLYGYDKIPTTLPIARMSLGGKSEGLAFDDELKEILLRLGLWEITSHSLISREEREKFFPDWEVIGVRNALSEEFSFLRPSILISLTKVAAHNFSYGVGDFAIFELGKVYRKEGEAKVLGIAVAGRREVSWRTGKEGLENDFFYLKGIIESLLEALGLKGDFQPAQHPLLNPLSTAKISVDGEEIGFLGAVNEELAGFYEIEKPLYLAELSVDKLREKRQREKRFTPLPRFPAVERDISLIVKKSLTAERIIDTIREVSGELLEEVFLFDVYEGKPVPEGERSLAFSLSFRAKDRTLSSEEVDSLIKRIKEVLKERLEAKIRE